MCGRYVHFHSWQHLRQTLTFSTAAEVPPNYNVAPTHQVPVVREYDGKREGVLMRWGLIPSWAKDKKLALDQRPRRHGGDKADVSVRVQKASMSDRRGWILRMEKAGEGEATIPVPDESRCPLRFRRPVGTLGA